jgi:hypothetical protein
MRDDRYWPRQFDEMAEDATPVTLLNEPIREVIELRPGQQAASLYALLVGVRNQAQVLLDRLETRGVYVPREGAKRSGQGSLRCHAQSGAGAGGDAGARGLE